ncbi:hypothetical protein M514_28268 [Trichuris suis]|uniref:RNA-directed DNA polymerase n=2 Tax=Trichuris suis TaxID=68888 RepID=A0A085MQQ8_9BILA|nr:hypothetical protein M514_28268 [Trichuris suis]
MVSHQFLVADQLIVDVIIGTDFLAAHHVSIDVANNRAFGPTTGELTTNVIVSTAQPNYASLTQPLPATCGSRAIESQTDPLEYCSVPRYRTDNAAVELPRHPPLYSGLISSYSHLFKLVPGSTSVAEHQIRTSGTPVRVPPRRIPERYRAEVVSQLQEMLDRGIIEPSQSPWMAPAVYTTKRSGEVRICVDYRELNKRTLKDAYPLPMPDDIFEKVASASVFSTLDMHCGFWQIPVRKDDIEKTAFSPGPGMGLYQFKRMPFGLCGAPNTFQRVMDGLLRDLPFVVVYLDDIIVFSPDETTHHEHLRVVLERLSAAGFTLRGAKCKIGLTEVRYLGHVISGKSIAPDPAKVAAIESWPTPTNRKTVKQFLGLTSYYRCFVKDYATIATPLYKLLHEDTPFKWTDTCEDAFNRLRRHLSSAPVLVPPKFDRHFELFTDASNDGLGATLQQDGHAIAFASRTLTNSERNYSVIERECLAIVFALKTFRHYLLGRHFTIFTDHAPLQWLTAQKMEGRLARWALALQEYDYTIKYRPGHKNNSADALSRRSGLAATVLVLPELTRERIRQEQQSDAVLRGITEALTNGIPIHSNPDVPRRYRQVRRQLCLVDGILMRTLKPRYAAEPVTVIIAPPSLRTYFLQAAHDIPSSGHQGTAKTLGKLTMLAYWPSMAEDVKRYCANCNICQQVKPSPLPPAPLQPFPFGKPWERVAVDILEVPMSQLGNRYLLVLQDWFTKWVEAVPMKNQMAATISSVLVEIFSRMGIPDILHTDQGANFESNLLRSVLKAFGVQKTRTSAYHPQGDGLVERANRSILQMLRTYVDSEADWKPHLALVLHAYRTVPHSSTGVAPFTLMYGRQAKLLPSTPVITPEWYHSTNSWISALPTTLSRLYSFAREHMRKVREQQKTQYDKRTAPRNELTVGTPVWLWYPRKGKLQPKWQPGWTVVQIISPNTVKITKESGEESVVHVNRIRARNIRSNGPRSIDITNAEDTSSI